MAESSVVVKNGFFDQKIRLRLSNPEYLIEKVNIGKISKSKIELMVEEGTNALIAGMEYQGRPQPYSLIPENFVGKRGEESVVYLYSSKWFDKMSFKFPVDVYTLGIDVLKGAKGKYALNAQANVEIADFKQLVTNYGKTVTREELLGELETKIRAELSSVVKSVASQSYSSDLNSSQFLGKVQGDIENIIREVKRGTSINTLGLIINRSSIKFYLNEMAETKEYIASVTGKINESAEYHLNDDRRKDQNEQRDKERQHEIDMERAGNTRITESTQNINKNINGKEEKKPAQKQEQKKKFCTHCGTKLENPNAKFCSNCGEKL